MGIWDRINPVNLIKGRKQTLKAEEISAAPTPTTEESIVEKISDREDLQTFELGPEQQFYFAARDMADALGGKIVSISGGLVGVAFKTEPDAELFYTFLSKNTFLQEKGVVFNGFDIDFRGKGAQDTLEINEARWMYTGDDHKYLVRFKPNFD